MTVNTEIMNKYEIRLPPPGAISWIAGDNISMGPYIHEGSSKYDALRRLCEDLMSNNARKFLDWYAHDHNLHCTVERIYERGGGKRASRRPPAVMPVQMDIFEDAAAPQTA